MLPLTGHVYARLCRFNSLTGYPKYFTVHFVGSFLSMNLPNSRRPVSLPAVFPVVSQDSELDAVIMVYPRTRLAQSSRNLSRIKPVLSIHLIFSHAQYLASFMTGGITPAPRTRLIYYRIIIPYTNFAGLIWRWQFQRLGHNHCCCVVNTPPIHTDQRQARPGQVYINAEAASSTNEQPSPH